MVIVSGVHLFPFRTEKLSPTAPMVLPRWESRSLPFYVRVRCGEIRSGLFLFSTFYIMPEYIIPLPFLLSFPPPLLTDCQGMQGNPFHPVIPRTGFVRIAYPAAGETVTENTARKSRKNQRNGFMYNQLSVVWPFP